MHKELVILVDTLEEASIRSLQDNVLPSFAYLAALHSTSAEAGFNLGLCAVHKQENGRDVQLKVLQRPGPFNVRDFHFALRKLHAATTPGTPEPLKTGLALKSLVAHLAGRKGLVPPLETTVVLIGSRFCFEGFRRAISDASRASVRLQFVALVPAVDAGGPAMSEAEQTTFLADIADAANATADFIPNDPAALQQLALRWLREFALPPPRRVGLSLPDALLHCVALSQVLPLSGACLAAEQQCACHHAPLLGFSPGSTAGVCSVTGTALASQQLLPQPTVVRVGRCGPRLGFQTGAPLPALRVLPTEGSNGDSRGGSGCGNGSKAAAAAGAIVLRCLRQVKVEEISEGLLWGHPHVLAGAGDSFAAEDFEAGEANDMGFAALCQVLREGGLGLLLAGEADVDTPTVAKAGSSCCGGKQPGGDTDENSGAGDAAPFTCFYAARPAADCATLLMRRIASAEELLPVVAALPPPCEPPPEALAAARSQLAALPVPASGVPFSPLDHSCGAFSLLRPLLQASLPTPPRPSAAAGAAISPAAVAQQARQAQQTHQAPQEERRRAQGPSSGSAATPAPTAGHGAEAAAQLGGRLQRLRLPDDSAAAAAATPLQHPQMAGGAGGRRPLSARQPAGKNLSGGAGDTVNNPGSGGSPGWQGGFPEWPGGEPAQQQRGDGVTRFKVARPATTAARGGKGRQRGSGGSVSGRGGLPLKRLRKGA